MSKILRHGIGRARALVGTRAVVSILMVVFTLQVAGRRAVAGTNWTVLAWNDLGMHCMDADFSVFAILPPYNTFHAQLVHDGKLVSDLGPYAATYAAVADAAGSINRTSVNKGNFWDYAFDFFGVVLAPDVGLTGMAMPGAGNVAQPMRTDATYHWYSGEGVPITPYDDNGNKNAYPMMRVTVWSNATALTRTDTVLPVSDEMDCRLCHASGSGPAAQPAAGWGWAADADRDYKLNILRLHDEEHLGESLYQSLLTNSGYRADGLYATVQTNGVAVICARCHLSNALGMGHAGVTPLTQAIHARHAAVVDPLSGQTLESSANRESCYRCHPGSATRCLRGAMGKAVAADGSMAMQCQSCHGSMNTVGASTRAGWFDEPNCQSCHTGSAMENNGQIRYTTVFEPGGGERQAVSALFATNPDTPLAGKSLYRFSKGHGGLQCEACHGATHAEYPSSHPNDNVQSLQRQGHVGMISDCGSCHNPVPSTANGGPHGMHPVGVAWINSPTAINHADAADSAAGRAACRVCHGTDYRGTVLSRALGDRTIRTGDFGTKTFWRGFQIGCYACHNGPTSESANPNRAPVVAGASAWTAGQVPVVLALSGSDADGDALTWRIVDQPAHGTVALTGNQATYRAFEPFTGVDRFTFAAWDGMTDSNRGVGQVTLGAGLWDDAVTLGGGWQWSAWFGYIYTANMPWTYHPQHGWLYAIGSDPASVVFWDPSMQFWWTGDGAYPFLYRFSDASWLWYQRDSDNPRWFRNLTTGQWEER